MFDREALRRVSAATALEGRAKYNEFCRQGDRDIYKGLTFFSPNINIFRDPRWGRGHETLGEDPFLTAELGKAFVIGMQGEGGRHAGQRLRKALCGAQRAGGDPPPL